MSPFYHWIADSSTVHRLFTGQKFSDCIIEEKYLGKLFVTTMQDQLDFTKLKVTFVTAEKHERVSIPIQSVLNWGMRRATIRHLRNIGLLRILTTSVGWDGIRS